MVMSLSPECNIWLVRSTLWTQLVQLLTHQLTLLGCPVEDGTASSYLIVLLNDAGRPSLGNPRSQLVLDWQPDDVSVSKQVLEELLHLPAVPGSSHVQHQDACLWFLLVSCSWCTAGACIPDGGCHTRNGDGHSP